MVCRPNIRFTQKIILLIIPLLLLGSFAVAKDAFELNTILMRSTFKLAGDGSLGTTFILGIPSKKDPNRGYYVLITAAHVLADMKGDRAVLFLREKINNTYKKIPVQIPIRKEENDLWVKHPEVDVAAMYVTLPKGVDIPLLSTNLLADDEMFEKFAIHPGDELLCLGYPFSAEANPAGFPILRSGKIASFPIVPSKETKYFLFDFEIFNGNSGGPVYLIQNLRTYGGVTHAQTIQFIAGLVSETFMIEEEVKSLYEVQKKQHPMGLAKVIHASFIRETVELLPSRE